MSIIIGSLSSYSLYTHSLLLILTCVYIGSLVLCTHTCSLLAIPTRCIHTASLMIIHQGVIQGGRGISPPFNYTIAGYWNNSWPFFSNIFWLLFSFPPLYFKILYDTLFMHCLYTCTHSLLLTLYTRMQPPAQAALSLKLVIKNTQVVETAIAYLLSRIVIRAMDVDSPQQFAMVDIESAIINCTLWFIQVVLDVGDTLIDRTLINEQVCKSKDSTISFMHFLMRTHTVQHCRWQYSVSYCRESGPQRTISRQQHHYTKHRYLYIITQNIGIYTVFALVYCLLVIKANLPLGPHSLWGALII